MWNNISHPNCSICDTEGMECPTLTVVNATTPPSTLRYPEHLLVECNHVYGYQTPDGDDTFTVSCEFDGHHTYLQNVTTCRGKNYLFLISIPHWVNVAIILLYSTWFRLITWIKYLLFYNLLANCDLLIVPNSNIANHTLLNGESVAIQCNSGYQNNSDDMTAECVTKDNNTPQWNYPNKACIGKLG